MVTLFLGRISRTGKEVGKSTDPTRERGERKKRKSGISQETVKTRRSNELRRRRGQTQKGKKTKRQDSRGRTSENILANI